MKRYVLVTMCTCKNLPLFIDGSEFLGVDFTRIKQACNLLFCIILRHVALR
jgi:hypothetical protein